MKNISKYKVEKTIIIPLLVMALISIITLYSATTILPSYLDNLYIKQIIWYTLGFVIAYIIMSLGNSIIYKNAWTLYTIGILMLLGLLLFAEPINNARCWYSIPGVGTIQPSEFMKIILIIVLGSMIHKFNEEYLEPTIKEEFVFLIKVGIVVLIPSVLTFLQPDTGVVIIYLLITITMLFISGIRYRWFIILFGMILLGIGIILTIYFINNELFINIFGTNFFLRVDRLLDWSSKSGYQLENGLAAIGSAGITGHGLGNTPIYFPEAQTDFIFAIYASNFGFVGSVLLILLLTFFDTKLIMTAVKSNNNINKYVMAGIVGMLIYQQLQNIGMTFGLMPITGITLPFISYGGSSLLSYMIMIGIVFNISNASLRYTN
ncbi:MAG: FtsW/RodA/SpoVE family cell cycle protein [Bacilli bacterium]|nr:FtsW/RodA/SpoVE family cell cycle protein [Bacilli bacterium]MDD4809486.1 FtsW/RodA/SpoVE family cell cycle protein [Bacilli bacterium]